ncbi:MAG: aldo/keto reductase [Anaerolineae bacterium]|nr:aldo/keto reductase [Anaerolineae bacterium]
MKTLTLGHSGIEVSALCLGILPFGTKVDEPTSFAILDAYFEAGGRFIDTANNYSMWHAGGVGIESETVLGKWMQARGNRSQLIIATKVGFNRADTGPSLTAATIAAEFTGSLRRLRADYVDLYYAHADIRQDPLEETLAAFDKLVKTGQVRAIGCSNYLAWRIERSRQISRAHGWAEYCSVQQRFTYLRPQPGAAFGAQRSGNDDLLDYCRANPDMRMLAYSPLLAGAYTRTDKPLPRQYAGADSDRRLAALATVAAEIGATPNQVIYAWLLDSQPSIIPLTAPTSLAQLEENLKSLAVSLTPEQMERLTTAGNP